MKRAIIIVTTILIVIIKMVYFSSYRINSISMSPTLNPGDRILCRKIREKNKKSGQIEYNRKDIVVFDPIASNRDISTNQIVKRIVGLPGDTVQIEDGMMLINGTYLNELNSIYQNGLNITDESDYRIQFKAHEIIFPNDKNYSYTILSFGPIIIPKVGMCIELSAQNLILYKSIIQRENGLNSEIFINDSLNTIINGNNIYTFNEDYVFVIGDNFFLSNDSRHWGFLPTENITGKSIFAVKLSHLKDLNSNKDTD